MYLFSFEMVVLFLHLISVIYFVFKLLLSREKIVLDCSDVKRLVPYKKVNNCLSKIETQYGKIWDTNLNCVNIALSCRQLLQRDYTCPLDINTNMPIIISPIKVSRFVNHCSSILQNKIITRKLKGYNNRVLGDNCTKPMYVRHLFA